MKRSYLLLIIMLLLFGLYGCGGNEVEPNEEKIVFGIPDDYLEYLPYDEVPNYELNFTGTIYTTVGVSISNKKFFAKNDDFYISDIIASLLAEYQEKDRLTVRLFRQDEQFETRMNKLELDKKGNLKQFSQIMKVKDGKIFNEIAYIALENGLTLSIEYRRFISDFEGYEKTYYTWRYTSPLNMVLHYPLMLTKNEIGKEQILIVPTPTKVVYHLGVSTQLPVKSLLKGFEKYTEANFRRFNYPNFSNDPRENEHFDLEENIELVKQFYIRDFSAYEKDNNLYFEYLNQNFKITFEEEFFLIDHESHYLN